MIKIYVGNLPYSTTEEDLEGLFSVYGKVQSVKIVTERETGRSKGFGFVTFDSDSSANSALEKNGTDFQGRTIKVDTAQDKQQHRGPRRSFNSRSSYREQDRSRDW